MACFAIMWLQHSFAASGQNSTDGMLKIYDFSQGKTLEVSTAVLTEQALLAQARKKMNYDPAAQLKLCCDCEYVGSRICEIQDQEQLARLISDGANIYVSLSTDLSENPRGTTWDANRRLQFYNLATGKIFLPFTYAAKRSKKL